MPYFDKYPLVGNKALQLSTWSKLVCLLNDSVRTDQRKMELEKIIKELSKLK